MRIKSYQPNNAVSTFDSHNSFTWLHIAAANMTATECLHSPSS